MRFLLLLAIIWTGLAGMTQAIAATGDSEAAIGAVFEAFRDGWNRPGFPGLENLLTPNADFVVVTGRWLAKRDAIVRYHRDLLKSFHARSHLSVDDISVRLVNEQHAVAHVAFTVTYADDTKSNGDLLEPRRRWMKSVAPG